MTHLAGNRYPFVILASPVAQPFNVRHSANNSGPAARWIAPSTPPPPSRDVFAAFTIPSTANVVMSATTAFSILLASFTHGTSPWGSKSGIEDPHDLASWVNQVGLLTVPTPYSENVPAYTFSPIKQHPAALLRLRHSASANSNGDRSGFPRAATCT